MDNYQEWDDPPNIFGDTSTINESSKEHIEPNLNTERSKPITSPFIAGYHFFHYMFSKLIYLILFCTFEASTIVIRPFYMYLKHCPRRSPLHLTLYPTGSINHASVTPRNDAKPVMVVGNSPKIFVQAKIRVIISVTVNLEDMAVNTHS